MVDGELQNTRKLLKLWKEADRVFMPVSTVAETLHLYGDNFGELLAKKIELMEAHRDDIPRIDPEYMWRMPGGSQQG